MTVAQAAVAAGRAANVSAWVNEALHRQAKHDRRMQFHGRVPWTVIIKQLSPQPPRTPYRGAAVVAQRPSAVRADLEFEANLRPRGRHAWIALPIRTFITLPVEVSSVRFPANHASSRRAATILARRSSRGAWAQRSRSSRGTTTSAPTHCPSRRGSTRCRRSGGLLLGEGPAARRRPPLLDHDGTRRAVAVWFQVNQKTQHAGSVPAAHRPFSSHRVSVVQGQGSSTDWV